MSTVGQVPQLTSHRVLQQLLRLPFGRIILGPTERNVRPAAIKVSRSLFYMLARAILPHLTRSQGLQSPTSAREVPVLADVGNRALDFEASLGEA
jgi:hypothetical protein